MPCNNHKVNEMTCSIDLIFFWFDGSQSVHAYTTVGLSTASIRLKYHMISGADPGFQVRGGALKKMAPSGGRRENSLRYFV